MIPLKLKPLKRENSSGQQKNEIIFKAIFKGNVPKLVTNINKSFNYLQINILKGLYKKANYIVRLFYV